MPSTPCVCRSAPVSQNKTEHFSVVWMLTDDLQRAVQSRAKGFMSGLEVLNSNTLFKEPQSN